MNEISNSKLTKPHQPKFGKKHKSNRATMNIFGYKQFDFQTMLNYQQGRCQNRARQIWTYIYLLFWKWMSNLLFTNCDGLVYLNSIPMSILYWTDDKTWMCEPIILWWALDYFLTVFKREDVVIDGRGFVNSGYYATNNILNGIFRLWKKLPEILKNAQIYEYFTSA